MYAYYFGLILLICRCLFFFFFIQTNLLTDVSFIRYADLDRDMRTNEYKKIYNAHTSHRKTATSILETTSTHETYSITCTIPKLVAKFSMLFACSVHQHKVSARTDSLFIYLFEISYNPHHRFDICKNIFVFLSPSLSMSVVLLKGIIINI